MNKEIKQEFKDFISKLSTEICKEVLLEELMKINNSFNITEKNYKDLYKRYTDNILEIKEELKQLQYNNKNLKSFTNNVQTNNEKVNRGLELIEGEHKKILQNIVKDNSELLRQYSSQIHSFNQNERKTFITEFNKNIDKKSKQLINEIKIIFNDINIDKIYKLIEDVSDLKKDSHKISEELGVIELNAQDTLSTIERIEESSNQIKRIVDDSTQQVKKLSDKVDYLRRDLLNELEKKSRTILILNIIIIILLLMVLFN